nr:MAG TPA: hypothetical protein [Caudoviricetes sp.]
MQRGSNTLARDISAYGLEIHRVLQLYIIIERIKFIFNHF